LNLSDKYALEPELTVSNRHSADTDLRQLAGHMRVFTASEEGMSSDEWDAVFFYCAFVFVKEGDPNTYDERSDRPPGYVGGRQASRVHYEEDIVCFPGYGPNAKQVHESPVMAPQSGDAEAVSPRFTEF